MPIRLKSKKARRGKLVASWDPWTQSAAGTFLAAPNRSGRIQSLMYDWTGAIAGTYRSSSNIVGTIVSQLEHWTSDIAGLVPRDLTAPSVPTGLTATPVGSTQVNLSWSASTDPIVGGQLTTGVASYRVYRDGVQVQIVPSPTLTWSNTGLTASTTYSYRVSAVDGAGNASAQSTAVNVTTGGVSSATVDWVAPTLNSAGQTFDGSSNDRKIAKYRVYYGLTRTAVEQATSSYQEVAGTLTPYVPPATTLTISGLTSGTWYFRVTSFDGDLDESAGLDVNLDGIPDTFTKVIA